MIICTECKKKVKRTHPNQKTCSEVCSNERRLRTAREKARKKRQAERKAKGLPEIEQDQTRTCTECGKEYKPKRWNQKVCSDKCRKERQRASSRKQWRKYRQQAEEGHGPLSQGIYQNKQERIKRRSSLPRVNKTRITDIKKVTKNDLYRHVFKDTKEATKLAKITETVLEETEFYYYFNRGDIECYKK